MTQLKITVSTCRETGFILFLKTKVAYAILFVMFFTLSITEKASAASYDCTKAKTTVEKTICLSPQLSRFDEVMASIYKTAIATDVDNTSLRQTQRDWQRLVRNQCSTEACLVSVYEHRIDQLRSGDYGAWANDFTLNKALGISATPPGPIGYGAANSADTFSRDWMISSRVFDTALAQASNWVRFDKRLRIVATSCGQPNAFYADRTVYICYELATSLIEHARQRLREGANEAQESKRVELALRFTILHELGHAAIDQIPNYPSLAPEETEADTFASVVLLSSIAPADIIDALWADHAIMSTVGQHTNYGDAHQLGPQRYANFACLAGGLNRALLPNLITMNAVTKLRATSCGKEWTRAVEGARFLSSHVVANR